MHQSTRKDGRDFRDLSIFPNSDELLLVEVNAQKLPERSRVMRYHLKQNTLQHYALPKGYVYSDAKLSPSGNYIVMKRLKDVVVKDEDQFREALSNPEIVIMKPDGSGFRVYELSEGYKFGAVLSNDDSKIAYWRGSFRKPGSKTLASQLNIWEFDFKTGADARFAGNFNFFGVAQMQYLPGDNEILFHAYGPSLHASSMSEYGKKYNHSHIYKANRGVTKLPEPILTEVNYATLPKQEKNGDLIFRGAMPTFSLFRKSAQGQLTEWHTPKNFWGPSGFSVLDVAANSSFIAFVYSLPGTHLAEGRGIGMFNTQTSQWETLSIPPLESSTPIVVKLAQ